MPGSGKSLVANLAHTLNIPVIIMGDVIRKETESRGLEPTRENIGLIMIKIREEEGEDVVAKKCLPEIMKTNSEVVLVEGIRSLNEVIYFKKKFQDFILIAIHASPKTRYERLKKRDRSDDPKTWEDFVDRDLRELKAGIGDAIAMADFMIINENDIAKVRDKIQDLLFKIIKA